MEYRLKLTDLGFSIVSDIPFITKHKNDHKNDHNFGPNLNNDHFRIMWVKCVSSFRIGSFSVTIASKSTSYSFPHGHMTIFSIQSTSYKCEFSLQNFL